ncbi:MAG: universal stress protein [Lunatimonas sp.]|uniref:universal stress protein n=1 Tax=Lunatimonas sp. TaxID=2060141 RepID=UPI00263B2F6C|nr:universal stress protein [Lunatimonas sp.]MCC5938445.1 universal stress protein [Lunatimonas sp.]
MKQFSKVMVGLDLTKMDETLLSNIKIWSPILGIEKIYFVHVAKDLSIPEELSKNYPDLLAPVDETIIRGIKHELNEFSFDPTEYEIMVKEGSPMETVLRWCKIKDVDLLVMGRKKQLEGSGSLAKNLAQKSPTSVLFIPEGFGTDHPSKLLVPLDFSDYSRITVDLALKLAAKVNATVACCHLYEVPAGYSKTGKSYEEFKGIMLQNVQKDFAKFTAKHDYTDLPCEFILKEKQSEARYIIDYGKSFGADMVIIGSRGRTHSAAMLLGSVAEKLIQLNTEVPTLILKKKGENMSFLEALLKL